MPYVGTLQALGKAKLVAELRDVKGDMALCKMAITQGLIKGVSDSFSPRIKENLKSGQVPCFSRSTGIAK